MWVSLGDNLAQVQADLDGDNLLAVQGLVTAAYISWILVSSVLGHSNHPHTRPVCHASTNIMARASDERANTRKLAGHRL